MPRNLIVGGGDKRASADGWSAKAPQGHGFWPRATELPGACPARSDVLTSACLIVPKVAPAKSQPVVMYVAFVVFQLGLFGTTVRRLRSPANHRVPDMIMEATASAEDKRLRRLIARTAKPDHLRRGQHG